MKAGGKADLHIHSSFSDGVYSPAELVKMAEKADISVISLADHDTIEGVGEAIEAARENGIEVIPAVELSAFFRGMDTHVLGYFIDLENERLNHELARFSEARRSRAEKMVKNLRAQGIGLNFEDVQEVAGRGVIGRPHVASALHRKGLVRSFDEAFFIYIGVHSSAYVRKYELKPEDAVELIHGAGGLAVLAHPLVAGRSSSDMIDLLDVGIDGLEVVHPKHTKGDSESVENLALKKGLLITGGSDFHGESRGMSALGDYTIPVEHVEKMKEALGRRKAKN